MSEHHRELSCVVKAMIRLTGIYATCIGIILTMEFFILRNGVSKLIGSHTSFWWLGLTLGVASVFALIYLVFTITVWLFQNIKKELNFDD